MRCGRLFLLPQTTSAVRASSNMSDLPSFRRVVTTHNEAGLAVVKDDKEIPSKDVPGSTGLKLGPVWITDSVPTNDNNIDIDGGERPVKRDLGLVSPGATNCTFTDLAPGAATVWHRTSSLDHNILLYGKIILLLEDGTETTLDKPGDTVIQRGTMHAWKNPGPDWARWITVLVDAHPAEVNGKALQAEAR
ncbi:hypothetical protein K474DRAFT_1303968 [Panus rudis PR-1116 ss-1]|nr:hypothetical protein K474DRAFT_1303968 [Panus rudis PR-1116 ss-1]